MRKGRRKENEKECGRNGDERDRKGNERGELLHPPPL
jgi:hypothetical protein